MIDQQWEKAEKAKNQLMGRSARSHAPSDEKYYFDARHQKQY
ncbi:hypothetical protein [Pseudomonas syringae]|nr:hypothetical protein [Pseudomonas syringae]